MSTMEDTTCIHQWRRMHRDIRAAAERIRKRGEQTLGARLVTKETQRFMFTISQHGLLRDTPLVHINLKSPGGVLITDDMALDLGPPDCSITAIYTPLMAVAVREEVETFANTHPCKTLRFMCNPLL